MRFTSRDLYIELCLIANSAENVVWGITGYNIFKNERLLLIFVVKVNIFK